MTTMTITLPVEKPIMLETNIWLVPCTVNNHNEFIPLLKTDASLVQRHHTWNEVEDEALCKLIEQYGNKKWTMICHQLNVQLYQGESIRHARQCRERWYNHLDPTLLKSEFSLQEDILILEHQAQVGNKWAIIARNLPGRTENATKNRWNSLSKKAEQKFPNEKYGVMFYIAHLKERAAEEEMRKT